MMQLPREPPQVALARHQAEVNRLFGMILRATKVHQQALTTLARMEPEPGTILPLTAILPLLMARLRLRRATNRLLKLANRRQERMRWVMQERNRIHSMTRSPTP